MGAVLADADRLAPGVRVTAVVSFDLWTDPEEETAFRAVFSGTNWPVDSYGRGLFRSIRASGILQPAVPGATTTKANGVNLTVSEFKSFVASRLSMISGLRGEKVQAIEAGDTTAEESGGPTICGAQCKAALTALLIIGLLVGAAYFLAQVVRVRQAVGV